jgi:hypothetical protein
MNTMEHLFAVNALGLAPGSYHAVMRSMVNG